MKRKLRKSITIMLVTFIIILFITLPLMAKEDNEYVRSNYWAIRNNIR